MKLRSCFLAALILLFNGAIPAVAEPVRIAAIFAQTGEAFFGNELFEAVRLAVEELNRQGGLLGRSIELIELDNQSSALGSKRAAEQAVHANVLAVVGASWSSHSHAMAPVCQAAQIPMISPISTSPDITLVGDYIFRLCYTDPFQGGVMARFAFKDLNAHTAAVLVNANSKFSEGLAEHFIRNYTMQGGTLVLTENYLAKTADFTFLINKIKSLQPEIIFLPGYSNDSAFIIKQCRRNGISTTFIGGDGWTNEMYKYGGDIIEGSYYSNHWHPDSTDQKSRQFVETFNDRFGAVKVGSALSYDCVYLLADAVRRAGSLEPVNVRNAIAATENFKGVTGRIRFDENGDPIKPAVIVKFSGGTSVYVKTVDP